MSDTAKRDAVLDRYSGNGWDYPDHEAMAWRIVELEAAIERVRALHTPTSFYSPQGDSVLCCRECWDNDIDCHYPCPTLRALEETP